MRKPYIFLWADRSTGRCSYSWRIGTRSTSFYLKPTLPSLSAIKISFHGPDERHAAPGFKVSTDRSATELATAAGGRVLGVETPQWFPGADIGDGSRRVVRFRMTPNLFTTGTPAAPWPTKSLKLGSQGLVIPPPIGEWVSDVELFITEGHPHWPDEDEARKGSPRV
jgi:hypothetical protein